MEIDFKLLEGINHVQIPVYVNGEGPFDFTLDTGATATSLSKNLVEKLGIETYPDDQSKPESIAHEKARVNALKIGSEILEEEEVWVVDFQKVLSPCSVNMGGVIGYSTLKNYRMSVNYRSKRLNLESNHNIRSAEAGNLQWADYEYAGGSHLVKVPVFINESGPFDFIVDTGAGATVVTPQLADKLGLCPSSPEEIQAVAPGGSGGAYLTVLKEFTVLSVAQQDVSAVILDMKGVTPRCSLIRNGILGFTFLKDVEMIIDYPAKRIAFNDKPCNS